MSDTHASAGNKMLMFKGPSAHCHHLGVAAHCFLAEERKIVGRSGRTDHNQEAQLAVSEDDPLRRPSSGP